MYTAIAYRPRFSSRDLTSTNTADKANVQDLAFHLIFFTHCNGFLESNTSLVQIFGIQHLEAEYKEITNYIVSQKTSD